MNASIATFQPVACDMPKARKHKRGIYRHPEPPARGVSVAWWTPIALPKGVTATKPASDAQWDRRMKMKPIRKVIDDLMK